jgi:hypothetical protein
MLYLEDKLNGYERLEVLATVVSALEKELSLGQSRMTSIQAPGRQPAVKQRQRALTFPSIALSASRVISPLLPSPPPAHRNRSALPQPTSPLTDTSPRKRHVSPLRFTNNHLLARGPSLSSRIRS